MFRYICGLALSAISFVHPQMGLAEARVAFVIGNSDYPNAPVNNALNDARSMTAVLGELGFDVTHVENTAAANLENLLGEIKTKANGSDIALFYYSGHAVANNGVNYLIPVDVYAQDWNGIETTSLGLDDVMAAITLESSGKQVMILDAARDIEPLVNFDSVNSGLTSLNERVGEQLMFLSAESGQTGVENDGPNSPFTASLVSALERPGLDIFAISRRVRASVREATRGLQIPQMSGQIDGELILREKEVDDAEEISPTQVTTAEVLWRTIEESVDPADFKHFIELFEDQPIVQFAQNRLQELEARGIWPTIPIVFNLPGADVEGGMASLVTECDIVVADPYDPSRVAEGVEWNLVNTRLAIRVCSDAVTKSPNNPRLLHQLGRALDVAERFSEAEAYYLHAMAQNYSASINALGYMNRQGRGREVNEDRAAQLYRLAADLGNRAGRTRTGLMYLNGWGVKKSENEAFHWIELAANDNSPGAIDALGNLHRKGLGTTQDPEVALELYELSASMGNPNATYNIGAMHLGGEGTEKDVQTAIKWFKQAIQEGNAYAASRLGSMYVRGWGVEQDIEKAEGYFRLAVDRGFNQGFAEIAKLYEANDISEENAEQAFYHYWLAIESGYEKVRPDLERVAEALSEERRTALAGDAANWLEQNGPENAFNTIRQY